MDLDNRNGSSKNLKHVDSSVKRRFPSTCSIENSQELFVIDVDVLNQIRKANQDPAPALQASPVSSSKVAGQSPSSHSGYSSSSATHSSETLVTAPPRGYDPNRIPASVFANKPANPGDWSVASNESLFSLHMGNSSLSRETFLTLYKSGELGKLEDPIKSVKHDESITISKPDEQNHFQPSLPPVTEGENMDKVSAEDMERGSNVASDTPKAAAIVETAESHYQEKQPPAPENDRLVCPSEGSGNSNKSFVFQVLEGHDDYKSKSIEMNTGKKDLEMKPSKNEPQEQQQPTTPKTSAKAGGSSWFSCFFCFSMCQPSRK